MLDVLEDIEDDVIALQKAFDLLTSGGSLVIEVPADLNLYDVYDAELHHFRRYSASELQPKLIRAGFKVSRRSHLGFILVPTLTASKLLNKYLPSRKTKLWFGIRLQARLAVVWLNLRWNLSPTSCPVFNFHLA
jgi:hypothetical protein